MLWLSKQGKLKEMVTGKPNELGYNMIYSQRIREILDEAKKEFVEYLKKYFPEVYNSTKAKRELKRLRQLSSFYSDIELITIVEKWFGGVNDE